MPVVERRQRRVVRLLLGVVWLAVVLVAARALFG